MDSKSVYSRERMHKASKQVPMPALQAKGPADA